jgi:hypothetical protein
VKKSEVLRLNQQKTQVSACREKLATFPDKLEHLNTPFSDLHCLGGEVSAEKYIKGKSTDRRWTRVTHNSAPDLPSALRISVPVGPWIRGWQMRDKSRRSIRAMEGIISNGTWNNEGWSSFTMLIRSLDAVLASQLVIQHHLVLVAIRQMRKKVILKIPAMLAYSWQMGQDMDEMKGRRHH